MKKIISTFSLIILTAAVFGQTGFKFGFQASPLISFASVTNDDANKTKGDIGQGTRIGFKYGLVAYYGLGENYAFHTGITHFVAKGYTSSVDSIGDVRVTSVMIPVGLKLRSNELTDIGTGVYFRGIFGANLDITTGYNRKFTEAGISEEIRSTREVNPFAASFFIGAGMEREFDFGTIEVGVTYNQGLMDINNKSKGAVANTILKLNYLSLDLAYLF